MKIEFHQNIWSSTCAVSDPWCCLEKPHSLLLSAHRWLIGDWEITGDQNPQDCCSTCMFSSSIAQALSVKPLESIERLYLDCKLSIVTGLPQNVIQYATACRCLGSTARGPQIQNYVNSMFSVKMLRIWVIGFFSSSTPGCCQVKLECDHEHDHHHDHDCRHYNQTIIIHSFLISIIVSSGF